MGLIGRLGLGKVLAITVVGGRAMLGPSAALAAKTRAGSHRSHHLRRHLIHRAVDVNRFGGLDCNGNSPVQRPAKATLACTDIRGFAGIDNALFYHEKTRMLFGDARKSLTEIEQALKTA